jgi:hypothetical protein
MTVNQTEKTRRPELLFNTLILLISLEFVAAWKQFVDLGIGANLSSVDQLFLFDVPQATPFVGSKLIPDQSGWGLGLANRRSAGMKRLMIGTIRLDGSSKGWPISRAIALAQATSSRCTKAGNTMVGAFLRLIEA